jgi:hypothetical protein
MNTCLDIDPWTNHTIVVVSMIAIMLMGYAYGRYDAWWYKNFDRLTKKFRDWLKR